MPEKFSGFASNKTNKDVCFVLNSDKSNNHLKQTIHKVQYKKNKSDHSKGYANHPELKIPIIYMNGLQEQRQQKVNVKN